MKDNPRLELLAFDHARALERFERANRVFFAERVGDRGEDFFEHFDDRLAARAREIAASQGVTTVKARVSTENLASHRVLQHCGFDQTGPTEAPNGSLKTFIGYRKDLHGTR